MIGQQLFGAASALYGGSSFGKKVLDSKCSAVRVFTISGETSRSWVLDGCHKVSKKHMTLNTGAFTIYFFKTHEEAVSSLSSSPKA